VKSSLGPKKVTCTPPHTCSLHTDPYGPDWENAHATIDIVPENCASRQIPIGGYLLGVSLRNIGHYMPRDPNPDAPAASSWEISDWDGTALYGGPFYWGWAMASCGIVFPEPLPNMNSATGYWLHRLTPEGDCPGVQLITMQVWQKRV